MRSRMYVPPNWPAFELGQHFILKIWENLSKLRSFFGVYVVYPFCMLLNLNKSVCSLIHEAEIPALLELHHPSRFEEKLSSLLPFVGLPSLNQCLRCAYCEMSCMLFQAHWSCPYLKWGSNTPYSSNRPDLELQQFIVQWAGTDTDRDFELLV